MVERILERCANPREIRESEETLSPILSTPLVFISEAMQTWKKFPVAQIQSFEIS